MRYYAKLHGTRLGDPITGLDGADTPASRRKALTELAQRSAYNTWQEMLDEMPSARQIELTPLPIDLARYYDSLTGRMTAAQLLRLEFLIDRTGYKSLDEATALIGLEDLNGCTAGQAACLIDCLTAKGKEDFKLDCERALLDAYAAMVGPVTDKQLGYLMDMAENAGYPSLGAAMNELVGKERAVHLTKGEASFMMDKLKSKMYEGDDLSFMGH